MKGNEILIITKVIANLLNPECWTVKALQINKDDQVDISLRFEVQVNIHGKVDLHKIEQWLINNTTQLEWELHYEDNTVKVIAYTIDNVDFTPYEAGGYVGYGIKQLYYNMRESWFNLIELYYRNGFINEITKD